MTYIIAEIGVNHDGDFNKAKLLIDAAAKAGADAAKFQMFITENEIHPDTRMAGYQAKNTGKQQTMAQMVKPLELTFAQFAALKKHCEKRKIEFLSSVFDLDSLEYYVDKLGCKTIKFGSGELTNAPLLLAAARKNAKVILSTGMATLKDIEFALGVLAFGYTNKTAKPSNTAFAKANKKTLKNKVVILQCTTDYPCADKDINLNAMETIAKKFKLPVGFSDHSLGLGLACAAVAKGAVVYEKHITLDNNTGGPDHKASLNPADFALLVKNMRAVEAGLGNGKKLVTKRAAEVAKIACRNLVAFKPIKKGEKFSEQNLWSLRTNEPGIDSREYYEFIGKPAGKNYKKNDLITR